MPEFADSEMMAYIERMFGRARGDDMERCEAAFKGMSAEYMNSDSVIFGSTHNDVLESYRRERRLHNTVVGMIKEALHI